MSDDSGEVNLSIGLGIWKDVKEIPKLRNSKKYVMLACFLLLFFFLDTLNTKLLLTCYYLLSTAKGVFCIELRCVSMHVQSYSHPE